MDQAFLDAILRGATVALGAGAFLAAIGVLLVAVVFLAMLLEGLVWPRKEAPPARVSVAFGSTPAACEIAPPEGYREPARGPCPGGRGVECRPATWNREKGWKIVRYWGELRRPRPGRGQEGLR